MNNPYQKEKCSDHVIGANERIRSFGQLLPFKNPDTIMILKSLLQLSASLPIIVKDFDPFLYAL